jgi:hypothetical protein
LMRLFNRFFLAILIFGLFCMFPATASAQIPDPNEWVDDLKQNIEFTVDGLWYDILLLHAQAQCCNSRKTRITSFPPL